MRFWRKKDPIAALTSRQPKTLKLAVAAFLEHYPESLIKVFKLGKARSRKVAGQVPIREAAEHIDEIEEYIKALYGGGDFQLVLYDPVGNEFASYRIGVMGKSQFPEMEDQGTGRAGDGTFLKDIGAEAIKNAMNPATQLEGFAKILQMLQPKSDNGFEKELMSVLINNHFEKQENQFSNLQQALEVVKTLQPTVQPEDPTVALITSLAPLMIQMVASKQGGSLPPNVQALLQHPAVAQALTTAQAEVAGAPQAAALPEPGEEKQPEAQQAGDADSPVITSAMTSFREHIKQGTPTNKLTEMFLSMVGLARAWQPDHVLFAPFIGEEDWGKLSEAFDAFCNAIPELAENAALRQEIKLMVATMLLTEEAEQPEEEEGQDAHVESGAATQWPDADRDDSGELSPEVEPAVAGSHVPGS